MVLRLVGRAGPALRLNQGNITMLFIIMFQQQLNADCQNIYIHKTAAGTITSADPSR